MDFLQNSNLKQLNLTANNFTESARPFISSTIPKICDGRSFINTTNEFSELTRKYFEHTGKIPLIDNYNCIKVRDTSVLANIEYPFIEEFISTTSSGGSPLNFLNYIICDKLVENQELCFYIIDNLSLLSESDSVFIPIINIAFTQIVFNQEFFPIIFNLDLEQSFDIKGFLSIDYDILNNSNIADTRLLDSIEYKNMIKKILNNSPNSKLNNAVLSIHTSSIEFEAIEALGCLDLQMDETPLEADSLKAHKDSIELFRRQTLLDIEVIKYEVMNSF